MGYLNSYYIGNLIILLIYPVHKLIKLNTSLLESTDNFGFTYENSIIYTMLVLLTIHYIRSYSLPQFISESVSISLLFR